jgi:hypothetical protein
MPLTHAKTWRKVHRSNRHSTQEIVDGRLHGMHPPLKPIRSPRLLFGRREAGDIEH